MFAQTVGPYFGIECRMESGDVTPAIYLATKDMLAAMPDAAKRSPAAIQALASVLSEALNVAGLANNLNRALVVLELVRARHRDAPEFGPLGLGSLVLHDAYNALTGHTRSAYFPARAWLPEDVITRITIGNDLHEFLRPAGSGDPPDGAICLRCGGLFAALVCLPAAA